MPNEIRPRTVPRYEYQWAVATDYGGEDGIYEAQNEADAREVLTHWRELGWNAWLERRRVAPYEPVEEDHD